MSLSSVTGDRPDTFVVLATHSWNYRIFSEVIAPNPGRWILMQDRRQLVELQRIRPHLVFILHWSWKIPAQICDDFECIGFHMTDLPYGRGGSPLQNLIVRGHRETKVTAFRVTDEMDAGPIYAKRPMALEGTAEEIYARASTIAAEMIREIIAKRPVPRPQEGEPVTFVRRTPAESRLPDHATPEQLYDFIRMLDVEGYPRAFLDYGRWRCEFSRASLDNGVLRAEARFVAVASQNG